MFEYIVFSKNIKAENHELFKMNTAFIRIYVMIVYALKKHFIQREVSNNQMFLAKSFEHICLSRTVTTGNKT